MLSTALDKARARKGDEGFTLIELLIVIVILGILAGIVVFSVQGIQNRGNKSACQADVASVTTAEEAFYAQQVSNPAYSTAATVQADLVPKFLHSWPAGTAITYTPTGTGFTVTGNNGGQTC
jgi:general secretion pathway protein G